VGLEISEWSINDQITDETECSKNLAIMNLKLPTNSCKLLFTTKFTSAF